MPRSSDLMSEEAWLDHLYWGQSVVVDEDAWVTATHSLLCRPELRARFAEASRARATSVFSWPRIVAAYLELWAGLAELARHQSGRPRPEHDVTRPLTTRAFAHYATACLDPDDELEAVPGLGTGELLSAMSDAMPRADFVDPELLASLARALLELRGRTSFRSLQARLATETRAAPRSAARTVAFALKHRWLRAASR